MAPRQHSDHAANASTSAGACAPGQSQSSEAGRRTAFAGLASGHRRSPPVERVAFAMTSSFAATIALARTVTYVQERGRAFPTARSFGRELSQLTGNNALRIHHSLPGTLLAFAAGGLALLGSAHRRDRWLGVPFGAGVALTMDELRVLAGRNNPYWGGRSFAVAQFASAAFPALLMCCDFARRGRVPAAEPPVPTDRQNSAGGR